MDWHPIGERHILEKRETLGTRSGNMIMKTSLEPGTRMEWSRLVAVEPDLSGVWTGTLSESISKLVPRTTNGPLPLQDSVQKVIFSTPETLQDGPTSQSQSGGDSTKWAGMTTGRMICGMMICGMMAGKIAGTTCLPRTSPSPRLLFQLLSVCSQCEKKTLCS